MAFPRNSSWCSTARSPRAGIGASIGRWPCGSCVDVRVEVIDRQNFPLASSTQHDYLAVLGGDVDLAVDADG
jgi:hypothetical protein